MINFFEEKYLNNYLKLVVSNIDLSYIDSKLEILMKAPKYWFVNKIESEAGLYFHYPVIDYNIFFINLFRIYIDLNIDASCIIFPLVYLHKLNVYKYLLTKYNFIKIFLSLCLLGIKYQDDFYISNKIWVRKCFEYKLLRTNNLNEIILDFFNIECNLLSVFDYNMSITESEYNFFINKILN